MKVDNFDSDLSKGKRAEKIVREVFSALTDKYTFTDVSNDPYYYHKGDIIATAADGRQIMIEVKNDEVIYKSGNVLCEEEVFYKQDGYSKQGFMYNDYEVYCVVSEPERKIYVLDFKILKAHYRNGEYKYFDYPSQGSDTYLLALGIIKRYNGIIDIINY